ncbi:MAG: hypothetical protein JWN88_1954 [Frankiales bacterium]|jgi:hypothetical protein|nr:hypothetical protein [Frankiales bacterium]
MSELEARRVEWERRQKKAQRLRDLGLLVLALGVLLLAYVTLLATGR